MVWDVAGWDSTFSGKLKLHLYPTATSWNEVSILFPYSWYWQGPAGSWTSTPWQWQQIEGGRRKQHSVANHFTYQGSVSGTQWGAELLAPPRGKEAKQGGSRWCWSTCYFLSTAGVSGSNGTWASTPTKWQAGRISQMLAGTPPSLLPGVTRAK